MDDLKCILLVEDDPNDVELTLRALDADQLANRTVVARDGVEALDYLKRRGAFQDRPAGHPVVVLLDLKMPRLDGIEVLKQMKSDDDLKRIPVVILTSSKEERDLRECYTLGANSYVVKPVKFPEFVEAVKQIGLFWAILNEPAPGSVRRRP